MSCFRKALCLKVGRIYKWAEPLMAKHKSCQNNKKVALEFHWSPYNALLMMRLWKEYLHDKNERWIFVTPISA
jgi:hypothetical protein